MTEKLDDSLCRVTPLRFILVQAWLGLNDRQFQQLLKISPATHKRWKADSRVFWPDNLAWYCNRLGCDPEWLTGRELPDCADAWRDLKFKFLNSPPDKLLRVDKLLKKDPPGPASARAEVRKSLGLED